MKKITFFLKTMVLLGMFTGINQIQAQSPCPASFSYSFGTGSTVNFFSTSTATSNSSSFTWTIASTQPYNVLTFTTGLNPSYTFTNNGIYMISYMIINTSPACVAFAQQTIAITNTTVPCNLNANFFCKPGSKRGCYFQ